MIDVMAFIQKHNRFDCTTFDVLCTQSYSYFATPPPFIATFEDIEANVL